MTEGGRAAAWDFRTVTSICWRIDCRNGGKKDRRGLWRQWLMAMGKPGCSCPCWHPCAVIWPGLIPLLLHLIISHSPRGRKIHTPPPSPPHLWLAWWLLGVPLADLRCWWAQVMLYEEVVLQGSWWAGQRGQHTRASVRGLDGLQPGCHVDIYDWFLCAVHTPKAYRVLLS